MQIREISVIGLGKLGMPLAACLAEKGYRIIGVDKKPKTVQRVNSGHSPVYEPGLEKIMRKNCRRIKATKNYDKAILNSQITFIVVPTPSDKKGGFSLEFVLRACKEIGNSLKKKETYHLVVLTSTVLPGSINERVIPILEASSGKQCGQGFGFCYNPEFVALGSAIRDLLNPDLVLIGQSDQRAGETLQRLYKHFFNNKPPVVRMNFVNAEVVKLSINTFVTTKISFANMLARICEKLPGSDVDVVTSALGLDSRIGSKYLKGAIGYGGPCFPRDNRALGRLAAQLGEKSFLTEATDHTNRSQVSYLKDLVLSKLPRGGVVGILGLAYKPNTDVVDESQGFLLAKGLLKEKVRVVAYDPMAMKNAKKILKGKIKFSKTMHSCVQSADTVILITPWEDFKNLDSELVKNRIKKRVLIDCWRILDVSKFEKTTEYIPVGIGLTPCPP